MSLRDAIISLGQVKDSQPRIEGLLQEIKAQMDADQAQLLMTLGTSLFQPYGEMYAAIEGHRSELVQMFRVMERGMEADIARLKQA